MTKRDKPAMSEEEFEKAIKELAQEVICGLSFNSIFVQYSHLSDTFLHKYMSSDRTKLQKHRKTL